MRPNNNELKTNQKQYDLEDRTLAFAKKVRAFVKKLRKTIANIEHGKQVVEASGSAGSNYTGLLNRVIIET